LVKDEENYFLILEKPLKFLFEGFKRGHGTRPYT